MKNYLNFWVIKYLNGYKSNKFTYIILQKFTYVNTCNIVQNLFYSVV